MEMYQVGPDELSEGDKKEINKKYDFYVYWYEYMCYEGQGLGVGVVDGSVDVYNLGHCSCYGPTESSSCDTYPLEEFLTYDVYDDCAKGRRRNPDDCGYAWWVSIVGKVREVIDALHG